MKTLLRPLLLSGLVVSMLAPAAIATAQRRHPHEGLVISIGPHARRWYHHHHWVVQHRRRWHGSWVWR